jgi:hypothetical protein
MATRMKAAKMRMNNRLEIGGMGLRLLGGTDGSSIPTPVIFLGGLPPREEDVCVSGSCSHSVYS